MEVAELCEEAKGDENYFNRTYLYSSFPPKFSSLMIRMLLSFWSSEDILYRGIASPALKKKKESQRILTLAVFKVPLTQNMPKWHIWGLCALNSFRSFLPQHPEHIETYPDDFKGHHFDRGSLLLPLDSAVLPFIECVVGCPRSPYLLQRLIQCCPHFGPAPDFRFFLSLLSAFQAICLSPLAMWW